jgi:aldehyde:ferredoxin oxidoreductase
MVVTRGPLNGYIASSNSGGIWGAELAKAGYFMVIFTGKAEKPSYLWIKDDKVELRDAAGIWGLDTHAATDALLDAVGEDSAKVSCIGPAGEKMSKIACIINDKHRAPGRTGVGAVMGSKNLKAVVVKGSGKVLIDDENAFKAAREAALKKIKENPVTGEGLPAYGTAVLVNIVNGVGSYPHKNWQFSQMENAEAQSGETLAKTYLTSKRGCFACPIQCGRVTSLGDKSGEGPEYESIWALGSSTGVEDLKPITEANYLCNELGLDTISAGSTVAAAMELYEKGFIQKEELEGGPELKFGSGEALVYWIEKMGKVEGFGKKLAEGSYRLGETYGHPEFSMSVKKQEMPAYDARGIQGIGLNYATSNRGGCHVRGYTISPEIVGLPEKIDPWEIEGKAQWVKTFQDLSASIDASGMCLFTSFALGPEDYANLLKARTGFDYSVEEILANGERIWNLERLFNLREGLDPEREDTLPKRLLEEPIPEGPAKGKVSRLKEMLPEYYELRGWDTTGLPTKEKLAELDLEGLE